MPNDAQKNSCILPHVVNTVNGLGPTFKTRSATMKVLCNGWTEVLWEYFQWIQFSEGSLPWCICKGPSFLFPVDKKQHETDQNTSSIEECFHQTLE